MFFSALIFKPKQAVRPLIIQIPTNISAVIDLVVTFSWVVIQQFAASLQQS